MADKVLSVFFLVFFFPRVGKTTGRVLCAAGDGKAYEWDFSRWDGGERDPVRTYDGHRDYLHAVAVRSSVCSEERGAQRV